MPSPNAAAVQTRLEETLFNPWLAGRMIQALAGPTDAYQEIAAQAKAAGLSPDALQWVSTDDPLLVQTLLQLSQEKTPALTCPAAPLSGPVFFRDLAFALLLRNDYLDGSRWCLPGQKKDIPAPYPDSLTGLTERWRFIQEVLGREAAFLAACDRIAARFQRLAEDHSV